MPTIARCGIRILLSALLFVVSCSDEGLTFQSSSSGLVSIAQLKSQYKGHAAKIDRDIRIEGYVTANDCYGEFANTIVVEDKSGGIRVNIASSKLYVRFYDDDLVRIECNGLWLFDSGGSVRLGFYGEESQWQQGALPESLITKHIKKVVGASRPVEPLEIEIGQITPSLIDRIVLIDNVEFDSPLVDEESTVAWCDVDPTSGLYRDTYRTLTDAEGNTLRVYVLHTASYATTPLPKGRGVVCGILSYFNKEYYLQIYKCRYEFES